jgi:hypothetical protein
MPSPVDCVGSDNEVMAVREGFEPSVRFRTHTFQACAFDHSATSPAARSLTEFRRYRKPEKGRLEVDIYKWELGGCCLGRDGQKRHCLWRF